AEALPCLTPALESLSSSPTPLACRVLLPRPLLALHDGTRSGNCRRGERLGQQHVNPIHRCKRPPRRPVLFHRGVSEFRQLEFLRSAPYHLCEAKNSRPAVEASIDPLEGHDGQDTGATDTGDS